MRLPHGKHVSARYRSPRTRHPQFRAVLLLIKRARNATDPRQNAFRISAGISPRVTTSETASLPCGFRTRKASRSTASLSGDRLMTQLEMITSTELSGSGMASMVPLRNSTLVAPAFRPFSRARASISSVMSRPYTLPVGPTRLAERSTSMPPPEPRSSTVCPASSAASAVGLPHPSDASTAVSGRASS